MGKVDLSKFNPEVLRAANVSAEDVVGEVDVWLPLQACKADPDVPGSPMVIEGYASSDHKDFEGEEADQDGLMWDYHLKHGWITDGHEKMEKATAGLGHPMEAKRVTLPGGHKATKYKGFLLDTPANRKLYETIQAATKLADSRYGFSIQGPVLRRDPTNNKRLAQVLITDVALTRHPVNPYATLTAVAKSLDALNKGFDWLAPVPASARAVDQLLDMAEKALDAGHPAPTVDETASGAALLTQSITGGKRKMEARKCKKADFKKVFGDLSDSDLKKMAKAVNIDVEDDDDVEDDPDKILADIEKKDNPPEKAEKALDFAMAEIRDHLAAGGKVILDDATMEGSDEVIGRLVEATKSLQTGDEATARGIMALLATQTEASKAMSDMRAELDEAKKSLEAMLGRPVMGKAVRPGAPIPNDRGEGPQGGDFVQGDQARKALTAAMLAESNKGSTADRERIHSIGRLLTGIEAHTVRVTKTDLENLGVKV